MYRIQYAQDSSNADAEKYNIYEQKCKPSERGDFQVKDWFLSGYIQGSDQVLKLKVKELAIDEHSIDVDLYPAITGWTTRCVPQKIEAHNHEELTPFQVDLVDADGNVVVKPKTQSQGHNRSH